MSFDTTSCARRMTSTNSKTDVRPVRSMTGNNAEAENCLARSRRSRRLLAGDHRLPSGGCVKPLRDLEKTIDRPSFFDHPPPGTITKYFFDGITPVAVGSEATMRGVVARKSLYS